MLAHPSNLEVCNGVMIVIVLKFDEPDVENTSVEKIGVLTHATPLSNRVSHGVNQGACGLLRLEQSRLHAVPLTVHRQYYLSYNM